MNPNLELLEGAISLLGQLADKMVFLGGCATGLLITESGASMPRVTKDLDAIVQVASLAAYHKLAQHLKKLGFHEDLSPEAPICRWRANAILLDVMPIDSEILGFGNRWYAPAFAAAELLRLPSGRRIRVLPAPYFLATKLEAFQGRGGNDFLMSKDMEDIIAIVDGRPEIVEEVRNAEENLRLFLQKRFNSLLMARRFIDAVPGHLPPDKASQARFSIIVERIRAIAKRS